MQAYFCRCVAKMFHSFARDALKMSQNLTHALETMQDSTSPTLLMPILHLNGTFS